MKTLPALALLALVAAVPPASAGFEVDLVIPNPAPGYTPAIKALCVQWVPPHAPTVGICEPRP